MSSSRGKSQVIVTKTWTAQVYVLAAVCLIAGFAIGYLFRGSSGDSGSASSVSSPATNSSVPNLNSLGNQNFTAAVADKAVEPMLAQLQQNPNDATVMISIADTYFDSKMYAKAIPYYEKALKVSPANADAITDLGTSYFYNGDADTALKTFDRALRIRPNYANTLFNVGIVKLEGKKDAKGALTAWQQLLQTNPQYPQRAHVEQLMAEARQSASNGQ